MGLQLGGEEKDHRQILAETVDFTLEPLAAHLFPDHVSTNSADAKLIALELYELGEAVLHDRAVEVDGEEGLKDVAAIYAILESSIAGRAIGVAEVESGEVSEYQAEIDAVLDPVRPS